MPTPRLLPILLLLTAAGACSREPRPLVAAVTLAGAGPRLAADSLSDPFGVAADEDGNVFVTDGAGGRLYRITPEGAARVIAAGLDMPSAVALAPDGSLVVANTGAQTIVRVDPATGGAAVVAGGFAAPVGVAVGADGTIFVADTYNDRICTIDGAGRVRALAGGGGPGHRDGPGGEALFDTPCGVAVAPDGALLIADTGNHRLRRVAPDGAVTTLAGTGEAGERDGPPWEAAFDEPTAVVARDAQSCYVADAGGSVVRLCSFGGQPSVRTLAGGFPAGLADGALSAARLNRPTGLAVMPGGALVLADSGNGLVRALVAEGARIGFGSAPDAARLPATAVRAAVPPRWPFDPPAARREIAGTLGEVRGEVLPDHDAWFHNGLDIPGAYGEVVRAIHGERVARPLAVEGAGDARERLRLPLVGYTHLRVGRDQHDRPLEDGRFDFRRDAGGRVVGVRLRRGTRFGAGEPLGTLNRLDHVHLIAGPAGAEVNALAALKLPGLTDTTPPVIEGVRIATAAGETLLDTTAGGERPERVPARGRVRVIVRAYDQVDGNAGYRRLGPYLLGYTVLGAGGSAAPGFGAARENIVFERLPADPRAVALAYAEGSQSGYEGRTIFDYVVTSVVRDGAAREEFWDADQLPPGDYTLRVLAADFFGNRTTRDVAVRVGQKE